MFSKIKKLESILHTLSRSLEEGEKNRSYTANQELRAENIHLAEGATLNIHMSNTIFSMELINECLGIIGELKSFLPIRNELAMPAALNNYRDVLLTKALDRAEGNRQKAADLLGITYRQMRYLAPKRRKL